MAEEKGPAWHALTEQDALGRLSAAKTGLGEAEAAARLEKYGKNEIAVAKRASALQIFAEQFYSPLVLMLILAALVSFFFEKGLDAVLIMAIVAANAVFGFIQDYNAERSIEALRKMGAAKALALRGGRAVEISAAGLVPGDVVLLREGMKVPADARLIEAVDLSVDESILTGESLPESKRTGAVGEAAPLGERKNMVFMDTLVVRGRATALVVSTGRGTEVGKIAGTLEGIVEEPTRFHREIGQLSGKISAVVSVLVVVIAFTIIFLHEAELIDALIISISLAVAAIPEGLPAVVTISLAMATKKMLKQNSLVRKLPVIENLGSVDVICTDKTGTLTENSMTVQEIYHAGRFYGVGGEGRGVKGDFTLAGGGADGGLAPVGEPAGTAPLQELLLCGAVCNDTIVQDAEAGQFSGDPTEIALTVSALKAGIDGSVWRRVSEIPFSSARKRMTVVAENGGKRTAYSKGAPEVIVNSCAWALENGKKIRMDAAKREELLEANRQMASKALRVLAFASKEIAGREGGANSESGMVFLGMQGMLDPPRKEVAGALGVCRQAGIRVMLLTGDNKLTALSIGRKIGFEGNAIDGVELEGASEEDFERAVRECDIFSRVSPEQKYMVLRSLKRGGHSVAMTGDGVNDAPALKEADVGIAMGIRGTDVSKEASDIILLDDNFATIVDAVRHGRGVFENIQKFVNYLLSNNMAEVFIVFIASLAGFLALSAPQLLWINLLTDGLPALALGTDRPRPGVMKEPPRKRNEEIISKELGVTMLAVGGILAIIVLAIFFYHLPRGIVLAQTMVFTCLVVYEFIRILVIRRQQNESIFSNHWVLAALGFSFALQLLVLYSPAAEWFGVVPLGIGEWGIVLLGGAAAYISTLFASRIIAPRPARAQG